MVRCPACGTPLIEYKDVLESADHVIFEVQIMKCAACPYVNIQTYNKGYSK